MCTATCVRQGRAPQPKSDSISIVLGPEARAYVREFGGFATEGKALEEALRLKADLLEDKVSQPHSGAPCRTSSYFPV